MPASARVEIKANVTPTPSSSVTGVSGIASPRIDVLAMRFTPSGAFNSSAKNGFSPCVRNRVAWVNTHSKKM